jgi:hypothetical protein
VSFVNENDGALWLSAQMHDEASSGIALEAFSMQTDLGGEMRDEAERGQSGHGSIDDGIRCGIELGGKQGETSAFATAAFGDEQSNGLTADSKKQPVDDMFEACSHQEGVFCGHLRKRLAAEFEILFESQDIPPLVRCRTNAD